MDSFLCGFIWLGFLTPQSLGSSGNGKPRASLPISNLFSSSWQAFKAYSWEVKKILLDGIVVSFDIFPPIGCAYSAIKYCCIVDRISPFGAWSIIWVS